MWTFQMFVIHWKVIYGSLIDEFIIVSKLCTKTHFSRLVLVCHMVRTVYSYTFGPGIRCAESRGLPRTRTRLPFDCLIRYSSSFWESKGLLRVYCSIWWVLIDFVSSIDPFSDHALREWNSSTSFSVFCRKLRQLDAFTSGKHHNPEIAI